MVKVVEVASGEAKGRKEAVKLASSSSEGTEEVFVNSEILEEVDSVVWKAIAGLRS